MHKNVSRRIIGIVPIMVFALIILAQRQSFGVTCMVYPDTARATFSWQLNHDTVTVVIQSQSADTLRNIFLSDHTDSSTVLIECIKDGVTFTPQIIEREFATIYPNKFTTRWVIGNVGSMLQLKYYSKLYTGNFFSWSAGHPFAVFGILTETPYIGPPTNIHWIDTH